MAESKTSGETKTSGQSSLTLPKLSDWMNSSMPIRGGQELVEMMKPALFGLHALGQALEAKFGYAAADLAAEVHRSVLIFRPATAVKTLESMVHKAGRYAATGERIFAHIFNDTLAATILVDGGARRLQELHEKYNGSKSDIPLGDTGFVVKPRGVTKPVVDACFITLAQGDLLAEVQFWCRHSYMSMKTFHEFAKLPKNLKTAPLQAFRACFQLIAWAKDQSIAMSTTVLVLKTSHRIPEQLKNALSEAVDKLPVEYHELTLLELAHKMAKPYNYDTWFASPVEFAEDRLRLDAILPLPLSQLEALLSAV